MKRQHAYSELMGMTVREASEAVAEEMKRGPRLANCVDLAILEWELFSDDQKIRNIEDSQLDKFEVSMSERGLAVTTSYKWANLVRQIVIRARLGDKYLARKPRGMGGIPAPPKRNDGTLRAYFHLKYKRAKLRGKAENTIRNYEVAFRNFARFLGRSPRMKDLTNDMLGDLMQWIVDHGRTNRTANKTRDQLCAVWRFANAEGTLRKGPTLMALTEPRRAPMAWTKTELNKLFQTCRAQEGYVANIPAGIWWLTLQHLLWNSGERIGAVLQLRWSEVDLVEGFVKFKAETRKGRTADNVSRLHPVTIAALQQFPEHDPDAIVFTWKKCRGSIWTYYGHLLKSAGLPHGRDSKFHRMRKSAATWFEIAGGNATDFLQHTSRQVTTRYLDPRLIGKVHGADLLFTPGEEETTNGADANGCENDPPAGAQPQT